MNPNEKTKLVNENETKISYKERNKKGKKEKKKKKGHCCSFLNNIKSIIVKLILLIRLIIYIYFLILSLYKAKTKKEPMKILSSLLKQNERYSSLPANESTKYSSTLFNEKKICSEN